MKRVLWTAALVSLAVVGSGCDSKHPLYPGRSELRMELALSDSVLTSVGQTSQLSVEARDGAGRPASPALLRWESSDPGIAEVDQSGRLTAVRDGVVMVTVRAGSAAAATARVQVRTTVRTMAWISRSVTADRQAANDRDSATVVLHARSAR